MKHSLLVDHEAAADGSGYVVRALLTLHGDTPTDAARIPLNLSIVLDRSGSMSGVPLQAAREAAALLVRRLRPEDVVSVVAYDQSVITVAEPATGEAQEDLCARITDIEAGGSTNLSGGWLRGHELVARHRREGGTNRVLLLTDGLANAGITDPARLLDLARGAASQGVTTSTIGFGADYDERLLRGMADAGGGNSWYIERPDQASGVFEEEIEGLLSLSAQNVAVEVRPTDAVQLVAVHNDYPYSAVAGGRRLELGDLYAREPKRLLLELFVPGLDEMLDVSLAAIVLHAHVLDREGALFRHEVTHELRATLGRAGCSVPEVRRELLLLQTARAREEALERRGHGDADGAMSVLRSMAMMLEEAPREYGADLLEQAQDLNAIAGQLAAHEFTAADEKYMAQRAYNSRRAKDIYEGKLRRGS